MVPLIAFCRRSARRCETRPSTLITFLILRPNTQSVFALYKGVTPPALGWAVIDSVLLGSLHNYRLFLLRHGMTERIPGSDAKRLTLAAHGIAGLFAGLTRYSGCKPLAR